MKSQHEQLGKFSPTKLEYFLPFLGSKLWDDRTSRIVQENNFDYKETLIIEGYFRRTAMKMRFVHGIELAGIFYSVTEFVN